MVSQSPEVQRWFWTFGKCFWREVGKKRKERRRSGKSKERKKERKKVRQKERKKAYMNSGPPRSDKEDLGMKMEIAKMGAMMKWPLHRWRSGLCVRMIRLVRMPQDDFGSYFEM